MIDAELEAVEIPKMGAGSPTLKESVPPLGEGHCLFLPGFLLYVCRYCYYFLIKL